MERQNNKISLLEGGVSPFPVGRIFNKVSEILQKTKIALALDFSLNPQPVIELEDKLGKIGPNPVYIDASRKSHLSVAYAQYLWLLGELIYKTHDSIALNSLIKTEEDLKGMCEIAKYSKDFQEYMLPLLINPVNPEYIEHVLSVMKDIRYKKLDEELLSELNSMDMDSPIGNKVNSICSYGLSFALCHEASHSTCGHNLYEEGNEAEEWEADDNAFWTMVGTLDEDEQFSAMIGVICTLISLLFLNPRLDPDPTGVHPKESIRLMAHFENILKVSPKEKEEKYISFLVISLCLWSGAFGIEDFPVSYNPINNKLNLAKIRKYFGTN